MPPPVLICTPNWLGDAIMSMPAILAFHAANPSLPLALLSRPTLIPLWQMTLPFQTAIPLPPTGARPLLAAARALRTISPSPPHAAYILPASPRAALPPFLAHIPNRIAFPGHFPRPLLLTHTLPPPPTTGHQAAETYTLLGLPTPDPIPPPKLQIPPPLLRQALSLLAPFPRPLIALLPGAARGPSKQWPPHRYAALAQTLATETHGTPLLLGSPAESPLCAYIAAHCHGVNLAGTTPLPLLAAILTQTALVLCNDSGGMHLAAALAIPLIAFVGITDPSRTGPLSPHAIVLQKSARRSRNVPRNSPEARAALLAITLQDALTAARPILHP